MKGSGLKTSNGVDIAESVSPLFIVAAHELKAPLALMRQLALSLDSNTLTNQSRKEMIEQIALTSERALRLTTDLSKTSRLENSLFDVEPVNPIQMLEEAARELMPMYRARGRRIDVVAHNRTRPMLAIANKDLLHRIIMNFGDNALHYSSPESPVEMRAAVCDKGQRIRLTVRDFGPSIATDMWRAFRKRQPVPTSSLHNRPGSSGLGLMIVQAFADAMHADVGVIRHKNGASFYIDIRASTQLSLW